jgi:hypothetical protein
VAHVTSWPGGRRQRGWTGRTGDGGDRGGRLLPVSRARVYRRIMLKRKLSYRQSTSTDQSTSTERTNGASWRRVTQMSSSVSPRPSFRWATDPPRRGKLPHRGGRSAGGRHPGSRTCSAPGPRWRSGWRHHDRDAARQKSVSSARAPAPPRAHASRQKSPAVRALERPVA